MKGSGPRSARAKRRSQTRHPAAARPEGWPTAAELAEALDVNTLAATLLAEMKPEVMRTILQRMDVQVRKALLAPHNIPVAKVSLRAATQVLALLRAEEKPAESLVLGSMLAPAAELFNDARVGPTQRMGLRLKLADLALPLIANSESTFKGLRTWHRWCDDSFEDITLAAVVGQDCSYAALAASYLAFSYPEIAERYEELRPKYPLLPKVAEGRLTTSNPLSRYLAARPDRKLPGSAAELDAMLREDSRVRQQEIEQARRQRAAAAAARERALRKREDALLEHMAPPSEPVAPALRSPGPLETPSDPGLSALPGMAEWAAAVTDSRDLTQRLINGEPPSLPQLRSIIDLSLRLTNLATVASRVLGEKVGASRGDIDRALTVILADPGLAQKLGPVPGTVAEVTEALLRLPPAPFEARPPDGSGAAGDRRSSDGAAVTRHDGPAAAPNGTTGRDTRTASSGDGAAEFTAARAAASPSPVDAARVRPGEAAGLSDLDSILHGEAGARLVALAGASRDTALPAEGPSGAAPAENARDTAETGPPDEQPSAPAAPGHEDGPASTSDRPGDPVPPADPEADALALRLVTAAGWARHPGGALAEDYAATLSRLDPAVHLDHDPRRRLAVVATALPMALLDPASGAAKLLDLEVGELAEWPGVVSLRRLIAEFARNGGSLYAPDMQLHALLSFRLTKIRYRARQIRETAGTRTLKYDKATKVYRAWFAPGGRLRPLLDCLESTEFSKLQVLVDDAQKVGAVRSIGETLSELFDKGKPRIVAGARQSLVDSYDEVVNLGTSILTVHRSILERASARHDAHRRFQRTTDFGDRVERLREAVGAELDGPNPPPEPVRRLVNRALDFQHHIHPGTGPEPSVEWLLEHRPGTVDGPV